MGDRIDTIDRNGLRTPMQWDNSLNGGFSKVDESKLYRLPLRTPLYGFLRLMLKIKKRILIHY